MSTYTQDVIEASGWATAAAERAITAANDAETAALAGKHSETILAARGAGRAAYRAKGAAYKAEAAMEWAAEYDEDSSIGFDAATETYAADKTAAKARGRALLAVMSLLEW